MRTAIVWVCCAAAAGAIGACSQHSVADSDLDASVQLTSTATAQPLDAGQNTTSQSSVDGGDHGQGPAVDAPGVDASVGPRDAGAPLISASSSSTAPTATVATATVPTETVPTETVTTDVVPTDVVPTDVVPTDVVPTDVVPTGGGASSVATESWAETTAETSEQNSTTWTPEPVDCLSDYESETPPEGRPEYEVFPVWDLFRFDGVRVQPGCVEVSAARGSWDHEVVATWKLNTRLASVSPAAADLFDGEESVTGSDGTKYVTSHEAGYPHWSITVVSAFGAEGETLWERRYEEYLGPAGTRMATAGDYVVSAVQYQLPVELGPFEGRYDIVLLVHDRQGDLVWRQRLAANQFMNSDINAEVFDVDVSPSGTVVVAGSYDDLAFVQTRDAAGNLLWHRTFDAPLFWSQVRWTEEGEIVVVGSSAPDTSLLRVKKLTPEGADVWTRDLEGWTRPMITDIDLDSRGNVYLVGYNADFLAPAQLLIRVNAEQFTDVDENPDGGIPGWQSSEPDEGKEPAPARQCFDVAYVESYYSLIGTRTWPYADEIRVFQLCSGEVNGACQMTDYGKLQLTTHDSTEGVSSGCVEELRFLGVSYTGDALCCFREALVDHRTAECDDIREGMRCLPDDKCTTGHCRSGVCEPDQAIDCDDDLFCTGQEWCDPDVGCRPGFPAAFDDDPCTTDICEEEAQAVSHVPTDDPPNTEAGDAGASGSAAVCSDLCEEVSQVYVGTVVEEALCFQVWPEVELVDLGCGETVDHCRRTPNGEWYVVDPNGDPMTLPVSEGCAEYTWSEQSLLGGTVRDYAHVDKCCVGQEPFVEGEPVGQCQVSPPPQASAQ